MNHSVDEKNVVYADLDPTEGIVLNLVTKNYYRLNETGQVIWQGLSDKKSPDEIAGELARTFEISADEARGDVGALLDDLLREGLLLADSRDNPSADMDGARASKKSHPIRGLG